MNHNKKILIPEEFLKLNISNIIFVSGAFDILHFGHINFLREAKSVGGKDGKLLVVTFPDNVINTIKGEGRPIMKEYERVQILSELESVDYVVVWNGWESIVEFALAVRPKYFCITDKSYDHSKNNNWKGKGWEEVAILTNSTIKRIPIINNLSSSKFGYIFE